jgi:hypothetical protein
VSSLPSSSWPPEVRASLHRLVILARSREFKISQPDFTCLFETAMVDFMLHFGEHASTTGFAEGMRQGHIRGRRKGRGLPEIAKPRGRPMSVNSIMKKIGDGRQKSPNKKPVVGFYLAAVCTCSQ